MNVLKYLIKNIEKSMIHNQEHLSDFVGSTSKLDHLCLVHNVALIQY